MSFQMAEQQFNENINLLGGEVTLAHDDPEKFNLYTGLLNLARGLEQLRLQIEHFQAQINHID